MYAAKETGRTLIYIPIVHTRVDMGRLEHLVRQETVRRIGERQWRQNVELADGMWQEIENAVEGWSLPYERTRVYQDGLPVCGKETEIVEKLADAGSRNHRMLMRLKDKGATLMGTESPDLLIEEYKSMKQFLAVKDSDTTAEERVRQEAISSSLLEKRDRFIADRINHTLQGGETGVLFLGMLHSLEEWIDDDVEVVYPLTRPIRQKGKRYGG